MAWLDGKKTYIAAVLLGLGAVGAWLSDDSARATELLGMALGLAGLRSAVRKVEP